MPFLYPFTFCSICVRRSILSKTAELLGFSVNFRTVCANASSLLSRQDIADQSTRFTKALLWCRENNVKQRVYSLRWTEKSNIQTLPWDCSCQFLMRLAGELDQTSTLNDWLSLNGWKVGKMAAAQKPLKRRAHTRSDKFSYLRGVNQIGQVFLGAPAISASNSLILWKEN